MTWAWDWIPSQTKSLSLAFFIQVQVTWKKNRWNKLHVDSFFSFHRWPHVKTVLVIERWKASSRGWRVTRDEGLCAKVIIIVTYVPKNGFNSIPPTGGQIPKSVASYKLISANFRVKAAKLCRAADIQKLRSSTPNFDGTDFHASMNVCGTQLCAVIFASPSS